MILANMRGRLKPGDLQLVLLLLSRGSAVRRTALEQRLAREGPDPLLDAPELAEGLLAVRTMMVPSEVLFFYVMVRHALLQAGVEERDVADYLAALLLEFGQRDRARRVDWNDDHSHQYLVDILSDLDASQGSRRFQVMLHLGNYALWLAGLFPHYIEARRIRRGGPDLSYYDSLGRRGYAMASDHALADRFHLEGVLQTAADRFPTLRTALNDLSDRVLFPHGPLH
ncbi:MAG TPA: hypothetical protein VG692_03580 [Gemmatimonadales bacterium]|nr:hypothetical protein [Gemmatimonadales bacterium]